MCVCVYVCVCVGGGGGGVGGCMRVCTGIYIIDACLIWPIGSNRSSLFCLCDVEVCHSFPCLQLCLSTALLCVATWIVMVAMLQDE